MNMGEVAVKRIYSLIREEDVVPLEIVLYTQIVVRETFGPPPKSYKR